MSGDATGMLERLARLECGQVSDVLDEAGLPNQVLSSAFRPLDGHSKVAGIAACARGEPIVRTREPRRAPLPVDALDKAVTPGCVLLIDAGGFSAGSVIGGFMAYSLQRNGCRGLVVDGAVRDSEEIRELGLATWCRAVVPVNGARRWSLVETGCPIQLAGASGALVTLRPGDLVLGDADGVVAIPAAAAESIIADAEELARIERRIGEELRAGGDRGEVFKRNPRFDHVRGVV